MMYLNGEISKVYLNGHYHSAAYLGSTLVWNGLKKIPGEGNGMITLTNSSDGVVVLFVPDESDNTLTITNTAKPDLWTMVDDSSNSELKLQNSASESEVCETKNSNPYISSIFMNSQANASGLVVNKDSISEDVMLSTPKIITNKLNINPIIYEEELTLSTSIPDGGNVIIKPILGGEKVNIEQTSADGSMMTVRDTIVNTQYELAVDGSGDNITGESTILKNDGLVIKSSPEIEALNLINSIGVDGYKISNAADGESYVIWESPVLEDDGTLRITQVYSLLRIGNNLEIDKGLKSYTIVDTFGDHFDFAVVKGDYDSNKKSWSAANKWLTHIFNTEAISGKAISSNTQSSDLEAILINKDKHSHQVIVTVSGSLYNNSNASFDNCSYLKINDKIISSTDEYLSFSGDKSETWNLGFIPGGGVVYIKLHAPKKYMGSIYPSIEVKITPTIT